LRDGFIRVQLFVVEGTGTTTHGSRFLVQFLRKKKIKKSL